MSYRFKVKEEHFTKQLPLKPSRNYFKWASIAVVAILIFGIFFVIKYRIEQKQAEYAYDETKKALSLLIENFSKAAEKVVYLNEFEETKQKNYNNN